MLRKNLLFVMVLLLLLLAMSSCARRQYLKSTLKTFKKTEIVIPSDLECVFNKRTEPIRLDTLKPYKFIIYYDSTDCSSCRISHLDELMVLFDRASQDDVFNVLVIFSPRFELVEDLRVELMKRNTQFPIYVDLYGTFAIQNSTIPEDKQFHYFMIDPHGRPIFIGLPHIDEQFSILFEEILSTINQ